jgi:hypothetical protein
VVAGVARLRLLVAAVEEPAPRLAVPQRVEGAEVVEVEGEGVVLRLVPRQALTRTS